MPIVTNQILLFPITLLLLILLITLISNKRKTSLALSDNESKIITFIHTGTTLILKQFIKNSLIFIIGLICLTIFITNNTYDQLLKSILIIISFLSSFVAGWIGVKLSVKSIKTLLDESNKSSLNLIHAYKQKSHS